MKYKKWAPTDLCDYHREISTKYPNKNKLQTFIDIEKLITDDRMEYVWNTLVKRGGCDSFDIVSLVATNGPQGIDSLNIEKREELKSVVLKLTNELGVTLKNTVPYISSKDAFKSANNNRSGNYFCIYLPGLLKDINKHVENLLNKPIVTPRLADNKNIRKYFVRSCYSYFMKKFEKPLDEVTATLASVFIENINDGLNEAFNSTHVRSIRRGYKI